MDKIQLIIIDGILYTPASALSASYMRDHERNPDLWKVKDGLLGYRDGEGGYVLCRIKEGGSFDKANLAIALFDARETGQIEGDVQEVLMPNGDTFVIDSDYGQDDKLPPVTW